MHSMPRRLEKIVEVLAVTRVTEGLTGNPIAQITFGELAEITPELRQFFPIQVGGGRPPKRVGMNQLQLFYWGQGQIPYKVGTKWKLRVSPSGEISLKPE